MTILMYSTLGGSRMGKEYTYKQETVLEAIKDSYGIINTVSKRLQCSWSTADKYIKKWSTTLEAFQQETEIILDIAESTLFESIKNGDTASAKWMLALKGSRRGYSETLQKEPDKLEPLRLIIDWNEEKTGT